MKALGKSRVPFGIPEYSDPTTSSAVFDLSHDDILLAPVEAPATTNSNTATANGEALPAGLFPDQLSPNPLTALNFALKSLVPENGKVLIFEPCRPDLRLAILQRGARYVDGGRLLDGRPDPAVLRYYENQAIDLICLETDDEIPAKINAPILIDTRSRPFQPIDTKPNQVTLHTLGPRDGLGEGLGAWVYGLKYSEPWPFALPGLKRKLEDILISPNFKNRAESRASSLDKALSGLSTAANNAGFESLIRAGYLWLGKPGFSSYQIQEALLYAGIGSFACSHHAYRHRVRLAPPPLEFLEPISEAFIRSSQVFAK